MKKTPLIATVFLLVCSKVIGAPISWGTPVDIATASDVITEGTLVEAINASSSSESNLTVNGVDFTGMKLFGGSASLDFSAVDESTTYGQMLDTLNYGTVPVEGLTLGGGSLLNGVEYKIQVWYSDIREGYMNRVMIFGDGETTNTVSLAAYPGQYAIGTFTADGATQILAITGTISAAHIQAYQIRRVGDLPEQPLPPTGLTAAPGNGFVSLNWDDNTEGDLDGYSVYRSTISHNYGVALTNGLNSSDYVDNTAENGTTYYYVVSATDTDGNESAQSSEVSATPVSLRFELSANQDTGDFPTLPTVSSNDLASGLLTEFDLTPGNTNAAALTDGTLAGNNYEVTAKNNSGTARYVIDLGSLLAITTVNSYSYGVNQDRASQMFSLYGSASDTTGTAAEFNELDSAWTLIASVDSTTFETPSQGSLFGVSSITGIDTPYRELMWVAVEPNGSEHTVWREFDVLGIAAGYDSWASAWSANIGAATYDFDADGLNNLYEYGLDGNPTNGLDQGTLPVFSQSGTGCIYVHPQRSDDTNITYTVETTTDLVSDSWTKVGYTVTGTNVTGGMLNFVTNEFDTVDSETFIRLRIEQ